MLRIVGAGSGRTVPSPLHVEERVSSGLTRSVPHLYSHSEAPFVFGAGPHNLCENNEVNLDSLESFRGQGGYGTE